MEELTIDDAPPDEVLVRFTATGLCHTDLEVARRFMPTPFPVVAGARGSRRGRSGRLRRHRVQRG